MPEAPMPDLKAYTAVKPPASPFRVEHPGSPVATAIAPRPEPQPVAAPKPAEQPAPIPRAVTDAANYLSAHDQFHGRLTASDLPSVSNEAFAKLSNEAKVELARLVQARDREDADAQLARQNQEQAARVQTAAKDAQFFLKGYEGVFGKLTSRRLAEGIPNNAYRNLSPEARKALGEMVEEAEEANRQRMILAEKEQQRNQAQEAGLRSREFFSGFRAVLGRFPSSAEIRANAITNQAWQSLPPQAKDLVLAMAEAEEAKQRR